MHRLLGHPQSRIKLKLMVIRLHMAAQLIKGFVVIFLFKMRQFVNHNHS